VGRGGGDVWRWGGVWCGVASELEMWTGHERGGRFGLLGEDTSVSPGDPRR
jgi:hypothetical protein